MDVYVSGDYKILFCFGCAYFNLFSYCALLLTDICYAYKILLFQKIILMLNF